MPDAVGPTDDEQLVLELCRAVLGRPEATLADRFAELGGTSMMASRLLVRIQERTGVRIPASSLLRAPDLRAVAQLVTSAAGDEQRHAGSAVQAPS